MRLLPLLLVFTFVLSCKNNTDETALRHTVERIYAKQDPYHNPALDTTVYSIALDGLIKSSKTVEKMDRERILQSEYPTDKPKLIEGEVFAGLYEGYTSYAIENIAFKESKAIVLIAFDNSNYKSQWKDTLLLTRENGWKLDDVRYGKGGGLSTLLLEFIQGE